MRCTTSTSSSAAQTGRSEPPVERPLYVGPPHVTLQSVGGLSGQRKPPEPRVVEDRWDLSALKLSPGSQVDFHAEAADYCPHSGQSEPRRLIVVTDQELQDRIAGRQELLLAELARVLKMQRDGRAEVKSLEARLAERGWLEQIELDRLEAAELNQRQVQRSLTSRDEGVPMHLLLLLADLENNRIDSPELQQRMRDFLAETDRLGRTQLPEIGRDLTGAVKSCKSTCRNRPSCRRAATPQPPPRWPAPARARTR